MGGRTLTLAWGGLDFGIFCPCQSLDPPALTLARKGIKSPERSLRSARGHMDEGAPQPPPAAKKPVLKQALLFRSGPALNLDRSHPGAARALP